MSECLHFIETSQTVVVVHHTFVQLPFEHRSQATRCRCRGQCYVQRFKAFKANLPAQ